MKRHAFAAGALALAAAAPGLAQADSWRFTTGADYTSGMYGDTRETRVLAIPLTGKYVNGPWTFRASIPFLSVDGPASVAIVDEGAGGSDGGGGDSGGGDVIGLPGARRASRAGFGDTTLAATYAFNRIGGTRTYLDITGKVRLPTGSQDEGLGSGATDFIAEAELGRSFKWGGAYVGGGRRFLGDNDRFERVDGWLLNTGAWLSRGKDEVGAYWTWREASIPRLDDPMEVGAYVSRRVTPHWKIQFGASAGLSDSSPDFGTAVTFTYRTDARRR